MKSHLWIFWALSTNGAAAACSPPQNNTLQPLLHHCGHVSFKTTSHPSYPASKKASRWWHHEITLYYGWLQIHSSRHFLANTVPGTSGHLLHLAPLYTAPFNLLPCLSFFATSYVRIRADTLRISPLKTLSCNSYELLSSAMFTLSHPGVKSASH